MLAISGVNSYYGELKVLEDIALTVDDGELVTLFGSNGHGKSTLLKTICGLHRSFTGSVKYNGEEITGLSTEAIVQKGLVYIAEDRHLFPQMTVFENLKLGAFNINARSKMSENLAYVYKLFPKLEQLKSRQAGNLSGGEARMLAIGRALMSNAKFLASDEPSLGLAPNLRAEVFQAISRINEDGISVLLVEQNVSEVIQFVKKAYLLENGRIVFEGFKEEFLKNEYLQKVLLGL